MAFKDDVNQAIHQVASALPAFERKIALPVQEGGETAYFIQPVPSAEQLTLARAEPGAVMFALYTNPPAKIVFFQEPIMANHYPVRLVVEHELNHRLGFDHSLDEFAIGCGMNTGDGMYQPSTYGTGASDSCPVCRQHELLAVAERLAFGIARYSTDQSAIPKGVGGTVPLVRQRLLQARAVIPSLDAMLPDRKGQVRSLLGAVGRAAIAYTTDRMTPDQARQAYPAVGAAWRASYELAVAYFAANPGPQPACGHPARWAVAEPRGRG